MGCALCEKKKKDREKTPSLLTMARNFSLSLAGVIKYALKTGQVLAEEPTINIRLKKCLSCNQLMNKKRCRACGCFIMAKAGLKSEKCPKGFW